MAIASKQKSQKSRLQPVQILDFGEVVVNYDETIDQKLAANPRALWDRQFATDKLFPCTRKGKATYSASMVVFDELIYSLDNDVKKWCEKNKKKLSCPKEALDLARQNPIAVATPRIFWISGQIGEDPSLGQFELVCRCPAPGASFLFSPVMAIGHAINRRCYLVLGKPPK